MATGLINTSSDAKAIFKQRLKQENDLVQLQRQFRIFEHDRELFQNQNEKTSKSRKILHILNVERKELITDLNVAGSISNAQRDNQKVETISRVLGQYHEYQRKLAEVKTHIKEVEIQITVHSRQLLKLSKKQVTDKQFQDRFLNDQNILAAQENKLEVAVRRFCQVQANNKNLRCQVKTLLIERSKFNSVFEKIIRNLTIGKKLLMDLIEQAELSYNKRDQWCHQVVAMRRNANNVVVTRARKCQKLEHQIEDEVKLAEFLTTKNQRRIMHKLLKRNIARRVKARIQMRATISKYQRILQDVTCYAKEEDGDEICKKFYFCEEEIFGMFNFINELNTQMEHDAEELTGIDLQIDGHNALEVVRATNRTNCLNDLNKQFEEAKENAELEKNLLQEVEVQCNNLMNGIEELFKLTNCPKTPFVDLLGDNAKINYYNAMLYLEQLEIRTIELVKLVYYREKVLERKPFKTSIIDDHRIRHSILPVEDLVPHTPCPLSSRCVERGRIHDVVDKLEFALDRPQVLDKFLQLMDIPECHSHVRHNLSKCYMPHTSAFLQTRYHYYHEP